MAAWAIRATSRSSTSTATTAATASPKAARKSRSERSRDFCSAIWARGSIEGWGRPNNGVVPAKAGIYNYRRALLPKPSPRVPNEGPRRMGPCLRWDDVLIHLPVLPLPIGIAQMPAQDLARRVARQGFDELHRFRRLEARDAFAGEVDDV